MDVNNRNLRCFRMFVIKLSLFLSLFLERDRGARSKLAVAKCNLVCIFRAAIDSWRGTFIRSLSASTIMLIRVTKVTHHRVVSIILYIYIYFQRFLSFPSPYLCALLPLPDVSSIKICGPSNRHRVHCIITKSMSANELTMRERRAGRRGKKFMIPCIDGYIDIYPSRALTSAILLLFLLLLLLSHLHQKRSTVFV